MKTSLFFSFLLPPHFHFHFISSFSFSHKKLENPFYFSFLSLSHPILSFSISIFVFYFFITRLTSFSPCLHICLLWVWISLPIIQFNWWVMILIYLESIWEFKRYFDWFGCKVWWILGKLEVWVPPFIVGKLSFKVSNLVLNRHDFIVYKFVGRMEFLKNGGRCQNCRRWERWESGELMCYSIQGNPLYLIYFSLPLRKMSNFNFEGNF